MNIDAQIVKLQELLRIEKEEDLAQYTVKMRETSYTYRREEGVCWFPILLRKDRYDSGERLIIHIERFKEHTQQHMFSSGRLVNFFCKTSSGEEESVSGVVNNVRGNEMMITLNCDELPHWANSGKLGIQLLFDENSYKEMEFALNKLIKTENPHSIRLKEVLLGHAEAKFAHLPPISISNLNESQNEALNLIRNANDVAIVHGPPGTGKTTTLISSIIETLKEENQLLVCAPSNAAVDLIVEKLEQKNVEVLRVGHPARVTESLLSTTVDAKFAHHQYFSELKSARKKSEEYFTLASKYKRSFGKSEREQRKIMFEEAHKLRKEADDLASYISSDIIAKANVIVCTLVGASNPLLRNRRFRTVYIDEAAQALEPACWIPILKAERVVLAGDHHQLPPTVKSFKASRDGLSTTLFEKIIEHKKVDKLLEVQYRMNSAIMGFSNEWFYDGRLRPHASVERWTLFENDLPIEFIDTAGCGFDEEIETETRSTFNKEECALVYRYLETYIPMLPSDKSISVGIVAPYKAQVKMLDEVISKSELAEKHDNLQITVNTIDSFQGQERDIICISLVRSNDKGEIGFLSDTRRMNVAMTRARKKLIVIGDSATICSNDFYNAFVEYATNNGFYRSGFEFGL